MKLLMLMKRINNRRGYAIPTVVAFATIIFIGVISLHFLTTSSVRQVKRLEENTIVDTGLDSMLAIAINRLKGRSWYDRWYADPMNSLGVQTQKAEEAIQFYDGDLSCFLVVEDCFNVTNNLLYNEINHVDVFATGKYKATERVLFARLRMRYPDRFDPRTVQILEYRHYEYLDITNLDVRNRIRAEVADDSMARTCNESVVPEIAGIICDQPPDMDSIALVNLIREAAAQAPRKTLEKLSFNPERGDVGRAVAMVLRKDYPNACITIGQIDTSVNSLSHLTRKYIAPRIKYYRSNYNSCVQERVRVSNSAMDTIMDLRPESFGTGRWNYNDLITDYPGNPYHYRAFPALVKHFMKDGFGNHIANREQALATVKDFAMQVPEHVRIFGCAGSTRKDITEHLNGAFNAFYVGLRSNKELLYMSGNAEFPIIKDFFGSSIRDVRFSDDAAIIAFVSDAEASLNQIYTIGFDGSTVFNVTAEAFKALNIRGDCSHPSFSADASRVVFEIQATPDTPHFIMAANVDGAVPDSSLISMVGSSRPCIVARNPSQSCRYPVYVPYGMVSDSGSFKRLGDYVLYVAGDQIIYHCTEAGSALAMSGSEFRRPVLDLTPLGGGDRVKRLIFPRMPGVSPSQPRKLFLVVRNSSGQMEIWRTANEPHDLGVDDFVLESEPFTPLNMPVNFTSADIISPGPDGPTQDLAIITSPQGLFRCVKGGPLTPIPLSSSTIVFTEVCWTPWAPRGQGF
ncbi:MAG: hypothetical protein CVV64_10810 [Candidatus Wallbacteria bacterium HGW-Wallbacteria-1]|jgi:hypothetical protein|uniref:Uncharacterized protein n=1 Tax=Candidatus Wallbacteria bacterium HGW-Wallbacteria-1 TaxID=2013854 RepID=A0A2N1PPF5_9BACT|nr:MAG: hypothetical protein CVV64_10810 [Candidatus Wallbacteria bacterium HGW-Wallbacteria-1]